MSSAGEFQEALLGGNGATGTEPSDGIGGRGHEQGRDAKQDGSQDMMSSRARSSSTAALRMGEVTAAKAGATGVNRVFWRRFKKLLIIGFGWKLCGPLALLAYLNVALCVLGGYVLATINATASSRALTPLLNGDLKEFDRTFVELIWLIGAGCMLRVVSALVGSFIRLRWRGALVKELHRRMLGRNNLLNYLSNVDPRVDNIDQRITQDVEAATLNAWNMVMGDGISLGIVGGVTSVATSVQQLAVAGFLPISSIFLYAFSMIGVTVLFMAPVVRLQFEQQLKEGAFRLVHTRAKEFAESIAFYAGVDVERAAAALAFEAVFDNFKRLVRWNTVLSLISDVGTSTLPILAWVVITVLIEVEPAGAGTDATNVTRATMNGRPVSYKLVSETNGAITAGGAAILSLIASVLTQLPIVAGTIHRVGHMIEVTKELTQDLNAFDDKGKVVVDPHATTLRVLNLSARTPGGSKKLFDDLSFEVKHGDPLLIMGPSGSGKTSLLRIVAGLWPFEQGQITRPASLFFLPQRPYLPLGSMRAQVLYPTAERMDSATDAKIKELLRQVGLAHIIALGLDTVMEWTSVLSGGELQRLSFARLLFHAPAFAIMDEATSALDETLQDQCMKLCEAAGITAISVGHRPTLTQHHSRVLLLDGEGGGRVMPAGDLRQPETARNGASQLTISTGGRSASREAPADIVASDTVASPPAAAAPRSCCGRRCCSPRFAFVCGSGLATSTARFALGAIACGMLNAVGQLITVMFLSPAVIDSLSKGRRPWGAILGALALTGIQLLLGQINFYLANMTSLLWRKRLVQGLEAKYFRGTALYDVNNILRVENADQRIAADPADFAQFAATLFLPSGIVLSLMQATFYGVVASSTSGAVVLRVTYLVLMVMATTSLLMVWVGAMTFRRNAMEGNFRRVHSRIAEFAESIAFYGGEEAEKARADREYARLERVYLIFLLAKYTMQGLALIVLTSTPFVVIKLYLEVHPIVDSHPPDRKEFLGAVGTLVAFAALLLQQPGLWGMFSPAFGLVSRIGELAMQCDVAAATDSTNQSQAVRFDDSAVQVEGLTVDTPDQAQATRCLFKDFSFKVSKGSSVLIMGPSGSGKTSLLRIIGGLWPVREGRISRPDARRGQLLFLPQRPYISLGSLRQQVLYPRVESEDMGVADAAQDAEIEGILQQLNLHHLLVYEGKLNAVKDWANILSGGEQQRLAFARLFFHSPEFALMDEATAALDVEMEAICMKMCKRRGITVISVGHRATLQEFHDQIIHLSVGPEGGQRSE